MNKINETALKIRGIFKRYVNSPLVKYTGDSTGNENLTFADLTNEDGVLKALDIYYAGNDSLPEKVFVPGVGSFDCQTGLDLAGVAVVTGGAQGFGAGLVKHLVKRGYFVYIADINYRGAVSFSQKQNEAAGFRVSSPLEVNITNEDSVEKMMSEIICDCGGLDLFISNAGVLRAGSVKEMSLKDFSFVTDVDYTGFFISTKYVSRVMAVMNKFSPGSYTDIIQINSKSGLTGSNKNGAYSGAKFGGIGLVQSFALELVDDRIKVNAVCPGNFLDGPLWSDPDKGLFVQYLKAGKVPGAKTVGDVRKFYEDKVPMKRGCTIDDVAKAVDYIIDQKYETGQVLPVTGGQVMIH